MKRNNLGLILTITILITSISTYRARAYYLAPTKDELEKEIADLEMIVAQQPNDAKAHIELGFDYLIYVRYYLNKVDYDYVYKAMLEFEKAIEIEPDWRAYHGLGEVYILYDRINEAIAMWNKALEIIPDCVWLQDYISRLNKYKSAIGEIKYNPNNAEAYYNLGEVCFDIWVSHKAPSKLNEATKALEKVIKMKPRHAEAHYRLGMCYRDKKELDKAIIEFKRTIELNPTNRYVYQLLVNCYEDIGRFDLADEYIKEAKKLGITVYKNLFQEYE